MTERAQQLNWSDRFCDDFPTAAQRALRELSQEYHLEQVHVESNEAYFCLRYTNNVAGLE